MNHKMNICTAKSRLGMVLADITCSREIWTEPIGIDSDTFLNCLLAGKTQLALCELYEFTKHIEQACGRTREDIDIGIVSMDIDILMYDNLRLHGEDWNRNYIRELIREL